MTEAAMAFADAVAIAGVSLIQNLLLRGAKSVTKKAIEKRQDRTPSPASNAGQDTARSSDVQAKPTGPPPKTIPDGRTGHIFRDAPGHLPDTPANRKMLTDAAGDPKYFQGHDKYGNAWYAKNTADGRQIWVQTRGNEIINGGMNATPRNYNQETGLSKPTRTKP